MPWSRGQLRLDANYNTGATNDSNLWLSALGPADLSAGIESPDGAWRLLALVGNANDTAYILTRSTQLVRARTPGSHVPLA